MDPINKVFLFVSITLCGLAIFFSVAAFFSAAFRSEGALIAGTILASLTTMASIIAGVGLAKSSKKNGAPA